MTIENRDIVNNNLILRKVRQLVLGTLDIVITDRDDILYKPTNPVEINEYNELINGVITRVIGKELGHHNGEELFNQGKRLQVTTNSVLYLTDVWGDSLNGVDKQIANIVVNELDTIKGIVQPMYKEYMGMVLESVGNRSNTNPLSKFNIRVLEAPTIISELDNREEFSVNEYETRLPNKSIGIPRPSDPILNYITTGVPRLDIEVNNLYKVLGEDKVNKIWDKYIFHFENWRDFNVASEIDIDVLSMLYLIVKNLHKNTPEIKGVSLTEYEEYCRVGVEYLKRAIRRYLDMVNRYRKSNLIVVNARDTEVTLLGNLYHNWLSNDGSIEVILGGVVGYNKRLIGYNELKEKESEYQEAWDRYVTKVMVNERSRLHLHYRQAYGVLLRKLIDEMEYTTALEIGSDVLEQAEIDGQHYVMGLDSEKLKDVERVCSYIVAKLIFRESNAYFFMESMREYSRGNSELSPKECASLATLELITRFVCTQVRY